MSQVDRIINARLINLGFYLIAFTLLWVGYTKFVVPIFGYMGFEWAPNKVKIIEALLAIIFFALILPSRVKRPSDFFIHVHFLLPIVPMLVLYGASDLPRIYMYFALLSFGVVCFARKLKPPKIKGDIIPIPIVMWGLLIIVVIYISSIISQGGLRYFNLDLRKVYEFRAIASEGLPGIYGYFSPTVSKVLLPFVLLLAVYRRKWLIAGLAISGSVMMFALTSHKAPLFYPFFILGIFFVMRSRRPIQLLLMGYIFVILVSLIVFFSGKLDLIVPSLALRRVYFVAAHLNFVYYDFFSTHPHVFLSNSKLTFGLIQYPYDLDPSHLIGYYYRNNELLGANTGWLGAGYMHFGFAGMFLYAFIVGLLLKIVDVIARKRELSISGAILFVPFFSIFRSTDLPTGMLTHGFLLALLLTWSCQIEGTVMSEPRKTIARFLNNVVRGYNHAPS